MKKVLAAALICVASSFAAWDYFPIIEYGKGEAKIGYTQARQGNSGGGGFSDFKVRYSPMQDLELLSQAGYIFGARHQVNPELSAGVDVGFPIPGTNWSFTPNVQYSKSVTDALVLGSNAQATIYTEDASEYTRGIDFSAGVELDLTMGKSTLWASCDVNTGLTKSERSVGNTTVKPKPKDEGRGVEIVPALGYVATVGNLALGTNIGVELGKDAGHDPNFNTFIGLDFSIKF